MTIPPQSQGGEETPTLRPPSLAVRKKGGCASVHQSVKAAAKSSSSSDESSSDSESGSSSSGSESSSENET